ncbi:hypothetical protein [Emticicia sp. BO119]|uniref:hypothetical protein n=1 Tax=Emticicia sp. BO119 TaxID=2757768 RepID=UPI0015F111DB|nr:hypothetical protein [Emticicia sp. BO119]MBA4851406.1 hypothetical protein [Emticicia sp. BO119]
MSKDQTKDLLKFLEPFGDEIINLVMWLRDFAWDLCPEANELIYDNYNAVAFGWSPTDKVGHIICSIAVGRSSKNVHFGFYWGNEIADPEKILLGQGNQYRYVLVTDREKFPKAYIEKLVNEAYVNALSKVKDQKQIIHGYTIVKSVSDKKRADKTKKVTTSKKKKN